MDAIKKYPPYGKAAVENPPTDSTINILTGSEGFNRARQTQSGGWIAGIKIVLPFREDPGNFKWPVNNLIVYVWNIGEPEAAAVIEKLAICCLNYGATRVVDINPIKMTRYFPQLETEAAA